MPQSALRQFTPQSAEPAVRSYNPFNPAFRETMRSGITDLLGGRAMGGTPSQRYRAGMADMLTGAVDFVPGVGEAVGVADTVQAARGGNYGTAAILGGATALGMLPVVGDAASKAITGAAKADELGDMVTMYHGSYSPVPLVRDEGLFGGIFASPNINAASSHGDVLNVIEMPKDKILTSSDLNYTINWEDTEPALMKAYGRSYRDLSDDQKAALVRAVIDDDAYGVDPDVLMQIMPRASDIGEASWEAQRIRGNLARNLGYSAVEMADEHGTSYLILPGAKPTMKNQ